MVHTASFYIDRICPSYMEYVAARQQLSVQGFGFYGNIPLDQRIYRETIEVDISTGYLSHDVTLWSQRALGIFPHLVAEMSWYLCDHGHQLIRMTAYEEGKRRADLVAFFTKSNIEELARGLEQRQNEGLNKAV